MDGVEGGTGAADEEEMLDEDEIRERNAHILRELQEKIEKEEGS